VELKKYFWSKSLGNLNIKNLVGVEKELSAKEILENNQVFKKDEYIWFNSVLQDILAKNNIDKSIQALLSSIFNKEEIKIFNETKPEKYSENMPKAIKNITSINEVKNFGLVNIKSPIQLNAGLTIFYGRNGSGKTTIYKALCNALGYNKYCIRRIGETSEQGEIRLQINNNTEELEWKEGTDIQSIVGVKIFDSSESQALVEKDQTNELKIVSFGEEYFVKILETLGIIEEQIKQISNGILERINLQSELIYNYQKIANKEPSKGDLDRLKSSDFNKEELDRIEDELYEIRNIDELSLINSFDKYKNIIGFVLTTIENETKPRLDIEKIHEYNELLKQYLEEKKEKKISTFDSINILPKEWISNRKWEIFISSSESFIEDAHLEELSKNKCIYCLQDLTNSENKKLVNSYSLIKELAVANNDTLETSINGYIQAFANVKQGYELIKNSDQLKLTSDQQIKIDSLIRTLEAIITKATKNEEIIITNEEQEILTEVNEFLIKDFDKRAESHKNNLQDIQQKQQSIKGLEEKKNNLQVLKLVKENLKSFEEYLENKDILISVEKITKSIPSLKRYTNQLRGGFQRSQLLKGFGERIDAEYKGLGFVPQDCWNMNIVTSDIESKRLFRMGDHHLKDVFSEGEQKIHSIADFLANAEYENFKGVFIFDDPVNSLDEFYIEKIAKRILSLIENENQVIVFTHNLIFLNALTELSGVKEYKQLEKHTDRIAILNTNTETSSQVAERKKYIEAQIQEINTKLKNGEKIEDDYIRSIYSLISGYLEFIFESKFLKDVVSRFRMNIRMASIDKIPENMSNDNCQKLTKLYNNGSKYVSRHANPSLVEAVYSPNPTELLTFWDEVIEFVKGLS